MEQSNKKIKLGIFVVGGLVLFLSSLFYLGREGNFFSKTFTIITVFKNVEGLNSGDNVWLSGVKIGTVKEVKIIEVGKVMVRLSLKEKQNEFVRKDAIAFVGSDGLVGNKIVVIKPGSGPQVHEFDTIRSESPTETQELLNLAKDVGMNTKTITDDLKMITKKVNNGEGILGDVLNDGELSQDLRTTISMLKSSSQNTLTMSKKINGLLSEVQNGQGLIAHLLNDSSYTNKVESTLNNIDLAGNNIATMSNDLQTVTDRIQKDDNIIHVLTADSLAADDLKESLNSTNSATEKLDENMSALQSNFLFRRYFKKKDKKEEKEKEKSSD